MTSASAIDSVLDSFRKQHEQFGAIRLRKYCDLLGGEVEEYERQARDQAQLMMEVNEIALAIGQNPESGMNAEEAFALLINPEVLPEIKIGTIMKYGPQGGAGAMAAVMPAKEQQNTRLITLVVQTRGTTKVDGQWQPLEDWTDENSRMLPRTLRNQILEFMATEGNGGKPVGKPLGTKAAEEEGPESAERGFRHE